MNEKPSSHDAADGDIPVAKIHRYTSDPELITWRNGWAAKAFLWVVVAAASVGAVVMLAASIRSVAHGEPLAGTAAAALAGIVLLGLGVIIAWRVTLYPRVVLDASGIGVVNPLVRNHLSWCEVRDATATYWG